MSGRNTSEQRVSSAQQRWVESLRSKRSEREREKERRRNAGLSPKRRALSRRKRSPSPAKRSPKVSASVPVMSSAVPATTPGLYCWRCGFSLPGYALFCTACGIQLNPDQDLPIPIPNHQHQQQLMASQSVQPGSLFQSPPSFDQLAPPRPSPAASMPIIQTTPTNISRPYQPPGPVAISTQQHSPRTSPFRNRIQPNPLPDERSTMEYLYRTLKWNLAVGGATAGPGPLNV
eukprot:TRINITY_DN27397_c0_g1_i1.p1 TRINITY_DN27397_c0_g1~~TRINITY_DN27397_c0_g1_i1.p1  ORF type:complete len:232 (+),score=20.06 TRINITY_DN27397_c0_g1_i1:33-728(+)